jgi:hypothetical protein
MTYRGKPQPEVTVRIEYSIRREDIREILCTVGVSAIYRDPDGALPTLTPSQVWREVRNRLRLHGEQAFTSDWRESVSRRTVARIDEWADVQMTGIGGDVRHAA